ncbi:MAG: ClpXP protease specificity-enhancing factor [Gammaproteobacteria bacterium]
MTSSRPYLIRAIYEWIVENGMTPHILVSTQSSAVSVPVQFVENGKIILNVAPHAVQALVLGNDIIRFSARFSGTPMNVAVPPGSVLAIYAKENGKGMVFGEDDDGGQPTEPAPEKPRRPTLKVVK